MEYPEPTYAQNIVVGVMFHQRFAWYVTDREYWYLDYRKYTDAWREDGKEALPADDFSERMGIAVLNEETAEAFLSSIEPLRVPSEALSEMMLVQRKMYEEENLLHSQEYYNDILDFIPCFFVQFDQKQFSSLYPEMIHFEKYVPDGWVGSRRDFLSEIPEKERYWMINGHDLFQRQEHS